MAKPRVVKLNSEVLHVLDGQRERFVQTFGRQPGEDDPVFFCTHSTSVPVPMCAQCKEDLRDEVQRGARALGIDPARALAAFGLE